MLQLTPQTNWRKGLKKKKKKKKKKERRGGRVKSV